MMRVLFDTNIVLDVLLARFSWHVEAGAIFQAARKGKLDGAVTTLSIANIFYVGRRLAGLDKARVAVRDCLDAFDVLPIDRHTLEAALAMQGSDFEDDIQIAAATQAGLDAIVTRDPTGFAASHIPAYSPAELLARVEV
ncbi:MAG: PIN domain-containing protein [Thermoguttaceae bacterium]